MAVDVTLTEDPARVLAEAGMFLAADPVRNFTMLTLLHERVAQPQPGRYWVAKRGDVAEGVVFQSPLDFPTALITRMEPDAIDAVVEAIAAAGISLPGIGGPVATAAAFAGRWTEASKTGATPIGGQRIYEATEFSVGAPLAAPRLTAGQSSPSHVEPSSFQKFPSPFEGGHSGRVRVAPIALCVNL